MDSSVGTTREYFGGLRSTEYDRKIRASIPGYAALHAMAGHLLSLVVPPSAQILVVGVGTGMELLSLAAANHGWSFTVVDVSADMLKLCKDNAAAAGIVGRVEYVLGSVDAVPTRAFHAATSILVSHFLKTADEKLRLFEGIAHRLEPGGSLVTAELMTARDDDTSSLFLRAWKAYYLSNGIPPSEVDADFVRRKQAVAEISEDELHGILEQSGFKSIRRFYQAFHFAGYLCTKG